MLSQSYGLILWAILAAAVALLAVWVTVLQVRLSRERGGFRAGGAERRDPAATGGAAKTIDELAAAQRGIQAQLWHHLQRVGIVRFNPFSDVGGDQSFVIALLDAQGNGFVLSRVFAKPVKNGESSHNLSDEERQAIAQAMSGAGE
jgi:hypothetical protein